MAFTGKWGAPEDVLGNVEPGAGAVPSESASSDLVLTQSVTVTIRHVRNVQASSSLLSITDAIILGQDSTRPVHHTLNLTDMAFSPRQIVQSITDTLLLSDSTEHGVFFVNAHDTLSLTDEAITLRLPLITVVDTIALADFARLSERDANGKDILNLSDTATAIGPRYENATSPLITTTLVFDPVTVTFSSHLVGLVDSVSVLTVHSNLSVHQFISLADQAIGVRDRADGISKSASSTLSLSDVAQLSIPLDASDHIVLTDSAHSSAGLPLSNTLALSDVVILAVSHKASTLSQTINLSDAVRFILEQGCTRFTFSPNIGSNSAPNSVNPDFVFADGTPYAPTPPPSAMPASSGITGFRLRFPSSGMVTDEVIVSRSPEFGNTDRYQFDRINRETRGGTLIVFADPIWPKINTLVLKFSTLKKSEAYAIRDFMAAHPGQEISLIDWEDRAWTGVITKQQDPIVQDDRNSFTASFEFEGERV